MCTLKSKASSVVPVFLWGTVLHFFLKLKTAVLFVKLEEKIRKITIFGRDGRLVERDEIVAINGESILDNGGGPEAMQQVSAQVKSSVDFSDTYEKNFSVFLELNRN